MKMTIKTKVTALALALALAACASGSGGGRAARPKGPENEPVAEEGGGAAPRGRPAKRLEPSEEVAKPKLEVSKEEEHAFDSALDRAQKILAEGPVTRDKCSKVASLFEDVADKNPKIASAHYDQGFAYEKCNLHDKAERAFKRDRKSTRLNSS